jgi:amino acid transporter
MKLFGALLITLSFVTPASSVFIIAPGVVQQAGTGAVASFLLAAVVGIFTAFVYAELSSAYPLTGGEYTIVGRILGPFWGFITLGVNLVMLTLAYATISLGLAAYLRPLFPDAPAITVALINIAVTTLLGLLNLRTNAVITGLFLALELLALAVLTWLGFANAHHPLSEFLLAPVHLDANSHLVPASFGLIGLATSVAIWAYNGYGSAVYLGEEMHDAPKHVAHAILWALAVTVIAEAVPVTAVLMGAPDLTALLASPSMLSDFIEERGGSTLNTFVSLGIALAILNANIAAVIMLGRQFYSTGRDRVWPRPINRALTRLNRRTHGPWVATLLGGVLASGACFIDIHVLFVLIGTGLVVIYALLCVAVMAARRTRRTAHGYYRMPFYPLPPLAALGMMGYVLYANYLDPDIGRPSLMATAAMIAASAAYYALVLRRRGKWVLRGPED